MNLPSEWSSVVRERVKKRASDDDDPYEDSGGRRKKHSTRDTPPLQKKSATSFQDACHGILGAITDAVRNSTPLHTQLAFDHIMSSAPYRCLVESLFASDDVRSAPEIPIVCRAYEESYMRGPVNKDEPLCVMGKQCECTTIDENKPFVGIRFALPHDDCGKENLCVLCHRRIVQDLFYDLLYTGQPFRGLIQKYGVICGENKEYCIDDLLICPAGGPIECFPLPSVVHQRNRYRVVVRNNVHYVQQSLAYPCSPDFQHPSL